VSKPQPYMRGQTFQIIFTECITSDHIHLLTFTNIALCPHSTFMGL